ncbi:MAG TPA: cation diffusion facilitator family transporter [Methanobacteriaceae archaeon]|jgi:cation diffusion facilitator family transporter|nr:cation diffusion facilitator family transporter [Euryarchaeota archaeon]HNR25337.1 cation diffusion facilitator family transporter [Methanobacteriaceae archaeon]HNS24758.1 cation diffusion facilitator family transporter [Methanobacteriaceae archaeon]
MDSEAQANLKKGEKIAKYSSLVNMFLALLKGMVGVLSGSIALIADAVNSFSDIFASIAVYIGLRLSQRKPDEKFPYGYYKLETFSSLVVSLIIIFSGVEIAIESFHSYLNPEPIGIPLISLSVAVISVIMNLVLFRYQGRVGKEIRSQALVNDGKHSLVDALSSCIVFIGIFLAYIGHTSIQGVAGFIIAILIIYMGLKLGKDALLVLLDVGPDPQQIQTIQSLLKTIPGVEGFHDIKIRRSGPFVFAELHLETKKELPVEKAYELSEKVKMKVKDVITELDTLTVQIEPAKKDKMRFAIPLESNKGWDSSISKHFGKAPYFLIAELKKGKLENYKIEVNPGKDLEKKRGIKAAEFLAKEAVDVLISGEDVGEGPSYVLMEELIQIVDLEGEDLDEILDNALSMVR